VGTTARTHRKARYLFVQSHSFGDLVLTMALLEGQPFTDQVAVMLTDHLHQYNKDALAVSTHRYTSLADVMRVVETWNPDLVFFVSAYGLLDAGFRPLPSLDRFLGRLRERGCRLVTADPTLGMSHALTMSQVDLPLSRLPWRSRFRQRRNLRRMFRSFSTIARMFDDVTHLYPVPVSSLSSDDNVRRVSFFNPRIVTAYDEPSGGHDGGRSEDAVSPAEPSWLFVLGASDLRCQLMLLGGSENTARVVAGLLEQTRRQGRRPVLIAPPPFIDNVSRRLSAEVEAELLPFCSYTQFTSRLFAAEYAFYWNILSCSILLRLSKGLPVFFFDEGHIARLLKPSYEAGIRCWYDGVTPEVRDARERLDACELARLVSEQQEGLRAIRAYWQRSPAPGEVIDGLLNESTMDRRT
jgi:hypothetical protein